MVETVLAVECHRSGEAEQLGGRLIELTEGLIVDFLLRCHAFGPLQLPHSQIGRAHV